MIGRILDEHSDQCEFIRPSSGTDIVSSIVKR
jgi:hypothetical protein